MGTTEEYVKDLEAAYETANAEKTQLANAAMSNSMSMFGAPNEDNLIRWQLDLREDLDRIYHLLKGDQVTEDSEGNMKYSAPDDPNLKPFNEYGVQQIMQIISFYLSRNTLLSNYSDEMINWKVLDFGKAISRLIYVKYEDMMVTIDIPKEIKRLTKKKVELLSDGRYVTDMVYDKEKGTLDFKEVSSQIMDLIQRVRSHHLKEKIKLYEIIVMELVDSVHSAYLRAFRGGERESLRTARTVTQSEPVFKQGVGQGGSNQRKPFSLRNPTTWI